MSSSIVSPVLLSIIIVNYRVPLLLEQCLHSVERAIARLQGETEVWVVDNASGDNSLAPSQKAYPWVHYIENAENVGFARANNQAIQLSRGKYVLLLNPDTVIGESTLSDCISFLEDRPQAGALGIYMMNAHGEFLPESKRGFPSPSASFFKLTGLYKIRPQSRKMGRYYMGWLSHEEPAEIEVLAGAFMMMRREALDRVGLLDERFFMYGEDIDLSHRIRLGGFSCHYLPTPILHYKGESSALDDMRYLKAFYGAMRLFFEKYYNGKIGAGGRILISSAIESRVLLARLLRKVKSLQGKKRTAAAHPLSLETLSYIPLASKTTKRSTPNDEAMEGLKRMLLATKGKHFLLDTTALSYDRILSLMRSSAGQKHTFHLQRGASAPIISPRVH